MTSPDTRHCQPLNGQRFELPASHLAGRYAALLLQSLGAHAGFAAAATRDPAADCAAGWANSGLVPLTGYADQPPLQGPGAIPACAEGVLAALRQVSGRNILPAVNGATLLSERAAFLGLTRHGQTSPNGSCHLLPALDGFIAINLARSDDWQLLPAWLESDGSIVNLADVTVAVEKRSTVYLADRAALLGLACAVAGSRTPTDHWFQMVGDSTRRKTPPQNPRVVDLSSLWAGPLASHLLQQAGCHVTRVESTTRPDGVRLGSPEFFQLLNGSKDSITLDFATGEGRNRLRQLLAGADVVIEGSRPRALLQLGIDAGELTQQNPGLIWLSLTGYGRSGMNARRVAFGDDAAAAAGLAAATANPPLFCGDAIADPLTGLHAALLATACLQSGMGGLFDLSLCNTTRFCLQFTENKVLARGTVSGSEGHWLLELAGERFPVANPKRRRPC